MEAFATTGRHWLRGCLTPEDLELCDAATNTSNRPGERLSNSSLTAVLALLGTRLKPLLPNAQPVRIVTFNKSSTSNWSAPLHQDRVITVRE